jgi:hypothetical protein
LLCRVEFDVRSPDTFIPAAAGLAWDDGLMGDGHFSSSVAMKKVDERGEMVTNGASFEVEVGVAPTPTPTATPCDPEPTSTPEPGVTPSPEPAPTPVLGFDLQVGLLKAGESFEMGLRLNENVTSSFDFYLLADTPAGAYTLYPNGEVEKGISLLYNNVPKLDAPYSTTVRPAVKIPTGMQGSTITFYAVMVETGRIPPVNKLSDLTPTTQYVILMGKVSAAID